MAVILWIDKNMGDNNDEKIKELSSTLVAKFPDDYDYQTKFPENKIVSSEYKLFLLHWSNDELKQEYARKENLKLILESKIIPTIVFYCGFDDAKIKEYNFELQKSLVETGFPESKIKSIKIIPTKTLLVNLSKALDNTKDAINTDSEIKAEWFSEKTPAEDLISKFSDLKHKIVHIFLPFDVNMDCIERVIQKNTIEKTIECFEDFLQEQLVREKKFSAKLDELHRIIYRDTSDTNGEGDKKNNTIFSVLTEMIEKKPDFEKIVMDNWKKLLYYAGISCNNEKKLEPNKKALIKEFFKSLDEALENKNKITENDITKILSHFKNWRESDCDDFHGWFEKLIKTLENLRRDLQQIGILKLSK